MGWRGDGGFAACRGVRRVGGSNLVFERREGYLEPMRAVPGPLEWVVDHPMLGEEGHALGSKGKACEPSVQRQARTVPRP